jgi:hypothetical protein
VTITANATDLAGNTLDGNGNGTMEGSPTDDYVFNFTTGYLPIIIPLKQGWSFISVPLVQPSTAVDDVLSSISGDYDIVIYYDASDKKDPWKIYVVGKPLGWNDLTDINRTMGFFIHIAKPGGTNLTVNGVIPSSPTTIHLEPGWNMVGYPCVNDKTRDDALNNLIYGSDITSMLFYDTAQQLFVELSNPTDLVRVGYGYWIYATHHVDWIVLPS